jgi:hypothetical protein
MITPAAARLHRVVYKNNGIRIFPGKTKLSMNEFDIL